MREEVLERDPDAAARGHLLPAGGIQVLGGGDVVREFERLIVSQEDRGPEQAVEDDVVLPDEVVRARVLALPPVPPAPPPSRPAPPPPGGRGGSPSRPRTRRRSASPRPPPRAPRRPSRGRASPGGP